MISYCYCFVKFLEAAYFYFWEPKFLYYSLMSCIFRNEKHILTIYKFYYNIMFMYYRLISYFLCLCLQKKLDFVFKISGGDISSIPGVSDAIEV